MKKKISKIYGENDYKGFILLTNKNSKNITKHYISAVHPVVPNSDRVVRVSYRDYSGDSVIDYRMGTNKKVDIGVKTWVKQRKKRNKRVSSMLPKTCYSFLFARKKRKNF